MAEDKALLVQCPVCNTVTGVTCSPSGWIHRQRREYAEIVIKPRKCRCRNHLGRPKMQHKSKQAAISWIIRTTKKQHMTYSAYRCPVDKAVWHVRTERKSAK